MQWIFYVGGIALCAVFFLLWRLESSRRTRAEENVLSLEDKVSRLDAQVTYLRKKKAQEEKVSDKLQNIEKETEQGVKDMHDSSTDDLLDLMRNDT